MHPINFGCDKIILTAVRLYARPPFMLAESKAYTMCVQLVMVNMSWSIDSCEKTVSAYQCHMTVSQTRVYNTQRLRVYFMFSANQLLIFN